MRVELHELLIVGGVGLALGVERRELRLQLFDVALRALTLTRGVRGAFRLRLRLLFALLAVCCRAVWRARYSRNCS